MYADAIFIEQQNNKFVILASEMPQKRARWESLFFVSIIFTPCPWSKIHCAPLMLKMTA